MPSEVQCILRLSVDTSSFVLELWRFLSISSLQEQHNIPNVSHSIIISREKESSDSFQQSKNY